MSTISNNPNPFNAESVKELKVPLRDAISITKDNGLDEVFFKVDNKEYVAFGKNLDLKGAVPDTKFKFGDKEATVTHADNEATGFWEGTAHGVKSTPGMVFEGTVAAGGLTAGVILGLSGAVFGLNTLGKAVSIGVGMGVGYGLVSTAFPGAIGGVYGLFKGSNYDTINTIAK